MNRDAAIEAGVQAFRNELWPGHGHRDSGWRNHIAAAIDAASPHLVGEPIQWIVVNHYGDPAYSGITDQEEALDRARRWNEGRPADSRYRVVALVPIEDQP